MNSGTLADRADDCLAAWEIVGRRGRRAQVHDAQGNSPTPAKRLRAGLEQLIRPAYGEVADIIGCQRAALRRQEELPAGWKAVFERLVEASGLPLVAATTTPEQH